MKQFLTYLLLLCSTAVAYAQSGSNLQVRRDSIKVLQAEFIIQNRTKDTSGFLFNKGNGSTEFRRLRLVTLGDTAIAIPGQDTVRVKMSGGSVVQPDANMTLSITPLDGSNQQLRWWKAPQDLYTSPKVGVIGGSQGKGAYTSVYAKSIIGRLTAYLNQVCTTPVVTNYCENGYSTRRLVPNGTNQWVDVNKNITKALADGNKIIVLVTPSNDEDPGSPTGGAMPLTETISNIALIEDACVRAGATLFLFNGVPRHDFALAYRKQVSDKADLLAKQFGNRCALVYKLLEDPANPYELNSVLSVGDKMHVNDAGADVAFMPMRDILVAYYGSNTQVAKYVIQRASSLTGAFTDFQTITQANANTYNVPPDQNFYRVKLVRYDGSFSPWSNIVQGISSSGNQLPVVNAGADQQITLPATLTLTATASDPDGTISSYLWTKVSGGMATITNTGSAQTTVTNLEPGTYVFRCTVTDNNGGQSSDDVQVVVTGSVGMVAAKFNFSKAAKPVTGFNNVFGNPHLAVLSATDATTGIGINTLATTAWIADGTASTALDNLSVTDDGGGFIVPKEVLQNIFFTNSTTLVDNLEITGLSADSTYRILVTSSGVSTPRFTRIRVNGVEVLLNATGNTSKAAIFETVKAPSNGKITIGICANPGSAYGLVSAVVVSKVLGGTPGTQLPVVDAGADKTVTFPAVATLTATASVTNGTIASYSWTKVSGAQATIVTPNAATTDLSGLWAGVYVFRCTVVDNLGAIATDDIQVTVVNSPTGKIARFNFSQAAQSVSGYKNVFGNPHLAILSGTDATTGIGINTIATSAYVPNGANSAKDNVPVVDDGNGFIVPQAVLANVIFTGSTTATDNLQLTGLTPGKHCKIMFVASASSTPRNTKARVNGQIFMFNATANSSKAAIFDDVLIPVDGKINIAFYANTDGSVYGVASAVVVEEYTN
jgi:hypothetical protein